MDVVRWTTKIEATGIKRAIIIRGKDHIKYFHRIKLSVRFSFPIWLLLPLFLVWLGFSTNIYTQRMNEKKREEEIPIYAQKIHYRDCDSIQVHPQTVNNKASENSFATKLIDIDWALMLMEFAKMPCGNVLIENY